MRRDAVTLDDDDIDDDPIPPPRRRIPGQRRIPRRRLIVGSCWPLVGVFMAFTLIRLFGWERTWYLDTFIAFTPYVALLAAVPLVFALVLRRWRAAVVAAVAAFALACVFVPRFVGHPDPGSGPRLSVMSSNMKVGAADPARIVALARDHRVDLLAIEEYTADAQRALLTDGLGLLLPCRAETPLGGASGSAIFSRYPLTDIGFQTFDNGFGQEYATVHVPGAQPLAFAAVHTRAPVDPSMTGPWAASLAAEPKASPKGAVRLLAGDFNATLDHERLRDLLDSGYRDVASTLGDGLTTTWPYDGRPIPPITLDHIFADPRIGAASFGTAKVAGTDHKAIFAVLTVPSAP
jgi:endonuclease/exonuclease/phosphatase (EEP) superfamily protein YafD